MSSCSIQNGGRRRGGKRSRKSHRGGNDLAAAPALAPVAAPAPAPVAAPAPESSSFLSGFAKGVSDFTKKVGDSAKDLSSKVTGSNPPQQPLASSSIPPEQSGGRRRKKSKTARKSRKSRRLKHKRSRKSRK
jgi:hypothetical protein